MPSNKTKKKPKSLSRRKRIFDLDDEKTEQAATKTNSRIFLRQQVIFGPVS